MAGNVRFESSSASSEELAFPTSYPNGQRSGYLAANLDRTGNFREGIESRMINSGIGTSRGRSSSAGDLPPLSHCLTLEPITIGDLKYTRSGELKKILGISSGSNTEDYCFGSAHSRAPPQAATEEIKRFKTDMEDVNMSARVRTKMFDERLNNLNMYDESLNKSNKHREAPNPKKQQRNVTLTNDRSGAPNILKTGTQINRNPSDPVTQRLDDRTKNVVLNKRLRTAVAEIRAEGRGTNPGRQSVTTGKDRDMLRDGAEGSDLNEEKIRRLPAGGEGWDRKMKKKRSFGTSFGRSSDGDGEPKRIMQHKFNSDPVLQSCDGQGFRSGSSAGNGRVKLDAGSLLGSSNSRVVTKSEFEKISHPKDFTTGTNKERLVAKGSKLNAREDNQLVSSAHVTKGKATRTPRGATAGGISSANFSRSSGSFEGWEHPSPLNRIQSISAANNRKRPLPTGSSSPPMAQWVGQRPQKMSRTRRANLVSPVSNHDEVQVSSEGGASDLGSKLIAGGTSSSLLAKGVSNGPNQIRLKSENVQSPARFSESEESAAGGDREIRSKEKGMSSGEMEEKVANAAQNVVPSIMITKKNRGSKKDDIGDGVRRQGRSGRASSFTRVSDSPMREKLESPAFTKPIRSAKPLSDKNGSKSGRPPLKKVSDRKVNRLVQTPSSSPDITGESDDDREELIAAANYASNASYLGCSDKFWKIMERIFCRVSLEDAEYLNQQLKSAEEFHESVSPMVDNGNSDLGGSALDEYNLSGCLVSWDEDRRQQDQSVHVGTTSMVDQLQDSGYFCGRVDSVERKVETPLYQRVLSALIVEDEIEGFEEESAVRVRSVLSYGDNFPHLGVTSLPNDVENRNGERIELGCDSIRDQKECVLDSYSCNGSTPFRRGTDVQNMSCSGSFFQGQDQLVNPVVGVFHETMENGVDGPVDGQSNGADALYGYQYEHMSVEERLVLELQSIDLYPEKVPELADGEDEAINEDIVKLQKELSQQVGRKKAQLSKMVEAVQKRKELEERALEQVAMNRLVELAYRKKLATRKSSSARCGVPKVSRQVANAFMKRTLVRLRKFEDTGKSCFSEPALRDVLLAPPPCVNVEDIMPGASDAMGNVSNPSDQDFAKTGPILNRGKKKEVLLDDVGGPSSLRTASSFIGNLVGGAKGKRSERDRVAKTGRGERKNKTKPKQKTGQLSTSVNELMESGDNTTHKKKDIRSVSAGNQAPSKDVKESSEHQNLQLPELGSIGDLGVGNDLGGNDDDLSNILDFDFPEGLQDNDAVGLDIPMDDISDLNMFV